MNNKSESNNKNRLPKFTDAHLAKLREEFAGIKTMNPDRLPALHAIFDGCNDEALTQLAQAGINFLSPLAWNAANRRGLKVPLVCASPAPWQS